MNAAMELRVERVYLPESNRADEQLGAFPAQPPIHRGLAGQHDETAPLVGQDSEARTKIVGPCWGQSEGWENHICTSH